jgi:hypothetical protein
LRKPVASLTVLPSGFTMFEPEEVRPNASPRVPPSMPPRPSLGLTGIARAAPRVSPLELGPLTVEPELVAELPDPTLTPPLPLPLEEVCPLDELTPVLVEGLPDPTFTPPLALPLEEVCPVPVLVEELPDPTFAPPLIIPLSTDELCPLDEPAPLPVVPEVDTELCVLLFADSEPAPETLVPELDTSWFEV